MLLSFTVRNHRSIRDEAHLDLARPALTTLRPRDGASWRDSAYAVAGIFGANASGKSTVIDAIAYATAAIRSSATEWQAQRAVPRSPSGSIRLTSSNPAASSSTSCTTMSVTGTASRSATRGSQASGCAIFPGPGGTLCCSVTQGMTNLFSGTDQAVSGA